MSAALNLFLRTMLGRAYPRAILLTRQFDWLTWQIALPLMSLAGFVFVYRALHAPEAFVGFVVIGGAMTTFWLNVLWAMASQLYWDREAGNLGLYILSPAPLMAILLGMAVGGMVMTFFRAAIVMLAGTVIFGVNFSTANLGLLVLTFILTMAALYGMGMLFASLFLMFGREAWHLSNLLQEPIYLVSGFYFPVKALGPWIAAAASIVPLTLGLDAMRQLLFPDNPQYGFLSIPVELSVLLVLGLVMIGASKFSLDRLEILARQEGRLAERRD